MIRHSGAAGGFAGAALSFGSGSKDIPVCRFDPERAGELARCRDLADVSEVSRERDRVATAIFGRKIGPPAVPIDFKAASAPVRAAWVERDIFRALPVPIGQPSRQQRRQGRQRRGINGGEIDPAAGFAHLRRRSANTPSSFAKRLKAAASSASAAKKRSRSCSFNSAGF